MKNLWDDLLRLIISVSLPKVVPFCDWYFPGIPGAVALKPQFNIYEDSIEGECLIWNILYLLTIHIFTLHYRVTDGTF